MCFSLQLTWQILPISFSEDPWRASLEPSRDLCILMVKKKNCMPILDSIANKEGSYPRQLRLSPEHRVVWSPPPESRGLPEGSWKAELRLGILWEEECLLIRWSRTFTIFSNQRPERTVTWKPRKSNTMASETGGQVYYTFVFNMLQCFDILKNLSSWGEVALPGAIANGPAWGILLKCKLTKPEPYLFYQSIYLRGNYSCALIIPEPDTS